MRVGIDARLLYYQRAGTSAYISGLIQGLANVADSVEFKVLLSHKDRSSLSATGRFERVKTWTPCHNRFEQFLLPLELVGHGIDLLHSPDFIPPFARRCKSVVTVHDLAFLFYPNILTEESRRYYSQVYRAARSTDAIIAVSHSTKRDIVEQLGVAESKVFVVHHGLNPCFRPIEHEGSLKASIRKLGIDSPFILFVGTIEPRKNLVTLLRAFAPIASNGDAECGGGGPDSRPKLVIVGGKGWLCDDVFSEARALSISDRVVFAGPVEGNDLVALYNSALFVVQPSIYEGFGLPPLEAMACGVSCIVSNTSSLPEVVGDAAIKVDPLDVPGWTDAMLRLISNVGLRRDLAQKGLVRSRQFSWDAAGQKTLEIYRTVAEGTIHS